jgi:hypothetical protein
VYEAERIQPGEQEYQRTAATGITSTSAAVVLPIELPQVLGNDSVNRPKCSATLTVQRDDLTIV